MVSGSPPWKPRGGRLRFPACPPFFPSFGVGSDGPMAMMSPPNPNRRGLVWRRWLASHAECSSKFHFKAMIKTVPKNFLSLSLSFPLPNPIFLSLFLPCLLPLSFSLPGSLFFGDSSGSQRGQPHRSSSGTKLCPSPVQVLITFKCQPTSLPAQLCDQLWSIRNNRSQAAPLPTSSCGIRTG